MGLTAKMVRLPERRKPYIQTGGGPGPNRTMLAIELAAIDNPCRRNRISIALSPRWRVDVPHAAGMHLATGSDFILERPSEPNFVKVTEVFLVPSSFLVAALGAADTNAHRAMVSLLALIISVLWWVCSREAIAELNAQEKGNRRTWVFASLPLVFAVGWLLSAIIHAMMWGRPIA